MIKENDYRKYVLDKVPCRAIAVIFMVIAGLGIECMAQSAIKCGTTDYSGHATALVDAVDWLAVIALYTFWIIEAIAGILVLYSALQIYIKMQIGEQGVVKDLMMTVGACLFILASSILFPSFFGYARLSDIS